MCHHISTVGQVIANDLIFSNNSSITSNLQSLGTKLQKRLDRGDSGINPLDSACKLHDIEYSKHSDTKSRSLADKELQNQASKRIFAKNASMCERATALAVSTAMGAKRALSKIGGGMQSKKTPKTITLNRLIKNAKVAIKKSKPETVQSAIKVAVASIKKLKKGKCVKKPRIIKIPSTVSGGVLPLIPIFAGLGALGSIVGSATGIVSAINQANAAQKKMEEGKRHNKRMEDIAIGKGYYLKTSKNGSGFYLKTKNH